MAEQLSHITAATIPLVVGGKAYNFRPLTLETLGQSCQRYTDAMLPHLPDPRESMQALIGHPTETVVAAMKELQRERLKVTNPNPLDVINWIMLSGERIARMLVDCIDGEAKPTLEQLALTLDTPEAASFVDLWMEASGLKENPTPSPSQPSKKRGKRAAKTSA